MFFILKFTSFYDTFYFMTEKIMYWINTNSTAFLDNLFSLITILGEAGVLMAIIGYYFWTRDKEKGIVLTYTLFLSLLTMGFLKAIFRTPRPFNTLDVKGVRQHTATGYSFPSGHSTGASTVYTSICVFEKKTKVTIICIIIFLSVAISRVYLRVHWPLDVFIGTGIGIIFALWVSQILFKIISEKVYYSRFLNISLIIGFILTFIFTLLIILGYDQRAFNDLVKNSSVIIGTSLGLILEKKYINFKVANNSRSKFLSLVIGLAGCGLIMMLKQIIGDYILVTLLRYFLIGIWVTYLFPLLAVKAKVLEK